jgi:hypothetical protein
MAPTDRPGTPVQLGVYGMTLFPDLLAGVDPGAELAQAWDRAQRDILRTLAPEVFARLAAATRGRDQVQVSLTIDVVTAPRPHGV